MLTPHRSFRRNRAVPVHLLEVPQSLRIADRCGRHPVLSGQRLQEWFGACTSGCTHLLGGFYHLFTRRVALTLLAVLTALHPFLHQFEGGALDAAMGMLTVRAFSDE